MCWPGIGSARGARLTLFLPALRLFHSTVPCHLVPHTWSPPTCSPPALHSLADQLGPLQVTLTAHLLCPFALQSLTDQLVASREAAESLEERAADQAAEIAALRAAAERARSDTGRR
jgi:hypothetical protein